MARSARRTRSAVTISDVAKAAGVSPMTVSRVINDAHNVRDATREAVNAVIRELGYAPNLAARSLAKAEAIRIGLIYSNPSAAFLSEFLVGVLDETQGEGAEVALVRCDEGPEAELAALKRLLDGGATGVVLPPPHSESAHMRRALTEAGMPGAVVGAGRPPEGLICARVDDRQAAADMTRYLLELGHRRIGLIVGAPNQTSSPERCAGVEAAVAEAPGAWVAYAQGYFDYASGLSAAESLLGAPEPPTAIFALNDDMAAAAVSVAHRRGLDVPGDLTVVGFDDTAPAVTLWPALTTVRQPIRAMAACAVELLLRRLRGQGEGDALDRVLPHTLVERQSAAPPRRMV
ncbi:MAG: LacI family DNA-binding transcriptional regulator [Caulobacteraceae bacterium]|nr:LacI family DNA-binding transcriptional regulator [Caulobacter sp.]